jgi:hypothetical protein
MPSLGEYLGNLVAEVTVARVHADLAAVRVAELYAGHPVLRHLPVPHFRLPAVTIDVPVVVHGVEAAPPLRLDAAAVRTSVDALVEKNLARVGVALSERKRKLLSRRVAEQIPRLVQAELPLGASRIADELVATCVETLRRPERGVPLPDAEAVERLTASLRSGLRAEIAARQPAPPRVSVAVASAEIKTLGSPESVLRLQLTISEDSLEWTERDDEGAGGRLVPE